MKPYSLRKSKKILLHTYHLFKNKRKNLPSNQITEIERALNHLQDQVMAENRDQASIHALKCEELNRTYLKKNFFENTRDLVIALVFALSVALLIRQEWFELYEIPSGSMRPTFKEKDRLVVSKTDFGINFPFTPGHFYFDPELVPRTGIIVFTVENMDVRDADTLYFYLFPGKKQFVKRLYGKPGDTVYFYGGQIYGIDKEGKDISSDFQSERLKTIDHVPFIRFEGNVVTGDPMAEQAGAIFRTATLYQMNQPIARLRMLSDSRLVGEMLPSNTAKNYGDLWGIKNFASARILTMDQIKTFYRRDEMPQPAQYYLELKHHPSLSSLRMGRDIYGRVRPMFKLSTSFIPLNESHLRALFDHLYTARFHVKDGNAYRFGARSNRHDDSQLKLPGVLDGTYEFYDGKAHELILDGVSKELPPSHLLNQFTAEKTQLLFNFGIDFDTRYLSDHTGEFFLTSRYSYFRDGDLYVMGAPILMKDDPVLNRFIEDEKKITIAGYIPFLDEGAPLNQDGKLDLEKIKKNGLRIPEKSYLALGDNFAMSSDSRDFGFVPQDNLRGSPSFIFWPPGNRFGPPNQMTYPIVTLPKMVVWGLAAICFVSWFCIHRKRTRLPLKF